MAYQLIEQYQSFFSTRLDCGQIDLYFPGVDVPFSIKKLPPHSFTSVMLLLEMEHTPVYFNKSTEWFSTTAEAHLNEG